MTAILWQNPLSYPQKGRILHIDLSPPLQRATGTDLDKLADITAEAFSADPVNLWLFGRAEALYPVFRTLADAIYLNSGFCHIADDDGAAMWIESGLRKSQPLSFYARLLYVLWRHASPGALVRTQRASEAMSASHPTEPHLYLFTIGTRQSARGKGVGKKLMRAVTEVADGQGRACYLENSNPANTGFYLSHGFQPQSEIDLGPGAPPLVGMWRPPQSTMAPQI